MQLHIFLSSFLLPLPSHVLEPQLTFLPIKPQIPMCQPSPLLGQSEKRTIQTSFRQGDRPRWLESTPAVRDSPMWSTAEDLQLEPYYNEGSSSVVNLVPVQKMALSSASSNYRPVALAYSHRIGECWQSYLLPCNTN